MHQTGLRLALVGTAALLVGAATLPDPTRSDIAASSFAASGLVAEGITVEATWPVSPDEAFALMTDPTAWKEHFQLQTNIDLAIGGRFELLFGAGAEPPAPVGSQGSEGCQILSYIPGEMLSFSWNAPPSFDERAQHTWVVITFSPGTEGGTTNLRLRHVVFRLEVI